MTDTQPATKPQKDRSPSFPFISLQTAIERLVAFEQTFGRHETPANKVGRAWKMKDGSSQAFQTLAALKSFGLLDYKGSGPARPMFITDDGRMYLRAQQDTIKREVLRRAALKPKLIEKFWHVWGADRPIDDICLDDLHFKHNFTQSAAETFLRVYDATISYAGLADSDSVGDDDDDFQGDLPPEAEVGDLVQIEVNGQLVYPQPVRVRAIQEHLGRKYVYVDGSESGVSMENVEVVEKGAKTGGGFTPPPLPLTPPPADEQRTDRSGKPGWKEERLIDDAGDETFLSYKGEPSIERYEFIRDYLDFRIQRLKPKP